MRDITMPLAIEDIAINDGRREVDPAAVKRLAESIEQVGLRHPITVRKKGEGYQLIAGLHRIEAHKKLDREHIMACIVSMTNAEARMWEISENLHRAELTNIQRAEYIEEWRELKAAQVANSLHPNKQPTDIGVSKTASELGVSRQTVANAKTIAEITDEAKEAAVEAGQTGIRELVEIGKEAPERQVAKVYELKDRVTNSRTWRDQFEALWAKGTEDDHAWARSRIDEPVMDRRYK